jgi:integrase
MGGQRFRPRGRRLYEADRRQKLAQVMVQLRAAGLGLPGRVLADGSREIRWAHLARLTGTLGATHAKYDRSMIEASGLAIDDDAYLTPGCAMAVDGIRWHPGPMKYDHALGYARLLLAACYIVIAYLSGMRPGEVLNLTTECLRHDPRVTCGH